MAIKLATEEELRNFNKQWQISLVATKLTMKEAQVLDIEEAQIVSRLDSNVKLVRDTTLGPFETIKMKGILSCCSSTASPKTWIRQNTNGSMESI